MLYIYPSILLKNQLLTIIVLQRNNCVCGGKLQDITRDLLDYIVGLNLMIKRFYDVILKPTIKIL